MNQAELSYQNVIQPFTASVINIIRKAGKYDSDAIDEAIAQVSNAFKISDERVINLARQNAVINLSLDIVLDKYAEETEECIKNLEL